ncbi:EamA family transporter [Paracoccus cavernae]
MSTRMTIAGDKTGAKPADAGQAGAPPAANRPMTGKEWLMLSALAVLWGCSFLFNALAVRDMPVLSVVFIRVALAAVVLIAVLRLAREHLPRDPAIWRALFVMGFANSALPFSLIVWGQTHVAAGWPRSSMRRRRCLPSCLPMSSRRMKNSIAAASWG